MYRLALVSIAWLATSLPAIAQVLSKGVSVNTATNTMQVSGYVETFLAMAPPKGEFLQFYKVDHGVLIIRTSKADDKIAGLTFWLADERAKASRQAYEFDVAKFDLETGEMTIRTKKSSLPNGARRPAENERTKR